jgi:hypothetical protein
MKLLEWLASEEHGREELAPSGGGHGSGWLGWRAEGARKSFYRWLEASVDDEA